MDSSQGSSSHGISVDDDLESLESMLAKIPSTPIVERASNPRTNTSPLFTQTRRQWENMAENIAEFNGKFRNNEIIDEIDLNTVSHVFTFKEWDRLENDETDRLRLEKTASFGKSDDLKESKTAEVDASGPGGSSGRLRCPLCAFSSLSTRIFDRHRASHFPNNQ